MTLLLDVESVSKSVRIVEHPGGVILVFRQCFGEVHDGNVVLFCQFTLLTGQIVSVSDSHLTTLVVVTVVVVVTLLAIGRPLLFTSVDDYVAESRGVPVRLVNGLFAVLVGLVSAEGVQIVGALLVLNLLVTPGAAALQVTKRPGMAVLLSVVFAEISAVGGILLSLAPGVPMSVFVTFLSFLIYLICRAIPQKA